MQSRIGPMDEDELAAIIDNLISESVMYEDSELARIREKAQKYYDAEESLGGDVMVRQNRSRIVSSDVSDTHGWIEPSLLRVFLGSDRVVTYEPRRAEAENHATEATDYINYVFLTQCDGYTVLKSAIWEGLEYGNGVIKHWWDDTPEYETKRRSNLSDAEFYELVSSEDVEEVLEHTASPDPDFAGLQVEGHTASPDLDFAGLPDGNFTVPPQRHDIKIKRRVHDGRLRVVAIPSERFRVDPNATILDEEHCRYGFHIEERTRSELIQAGYPRDLIDDLPAHSGTVSITDLARGRYVDVDRAPDRSTELLEVWEGYLQVDYDGDGIAEWRRVVTAAGVNARNILVNEEWEDGLPFTDLVPDPQPHRRRGRTLYEKVGDIQRINTTLWRGINDNLYWVNNPQRQAVKGGVDPSSMDKLYAPNFGDVIITTMPNAISDLPVPFIADKLLTGMELADRKREFRTGVSPATMSLDPEALQNQTAAAVNATKTAAYSITETYARNIAEYGGLKRLFDCLLKLVVKHQTREQTIRLRGEWVAMLPSNWDSSMDVIVNVGLGSGSRDRDMAMLRAIAEEQKFIMQSVGPEIAAKLGMGPDKLFATLRKMVEASGLRSPASFFPEVTSEDIEQLLQQAGSKPDPRSAEVQAKLELIKAEGEAKLQLERERLEMEKQSRQAEAALEWQRIQDQRQFDQADRQQDIAAKAEAALEELRLKHAAAEEQARREFDFRVREMEINAELKREELALEAQLKREEMMVNPRTPVNIEEADV